MSTTTSAVTQHGPGVALAARADGPSHRHGLLIALITLASTVTWRSGVLYAGGIDPVVAAKAALSGVALGAVLIAQAAQLRPVAVSAVPIWLLAGFLSTTMFGAYVSGLTVVSGVLVIRVVILATVGYLFVRAFGYEEAIRCWLSAMAIVAILAAVTGLPSLASGRLRGGVPAVHPNELAALCVFPVLGLIWGFVNQRTRTFHHVLLAVLVLITWATGSRTALGAAVLGAVVILCSVRRPTPSRLVALIVATAGFLFIALGTDLLTRIFFRGGRENVTAVASRSIAWSAALTYTDDPWRQWAGSGIAMKEIAVRGQYWTTQLLDEQLGVGLRPDGAYRRAPHRRLDRLDHLVHPPRPPSDARSPSACWRRSCCGASRRAGSSTAPPSSSPSGSCPSPARLRRRAGGSMRT